MGTKIVDKRTKIIVKEIFKAVLISSIFLFLLYFYEEYTTKRDLENAKILREYIKKNNVN